MFFVYVIYAKASDKIYIGFTADVQKRLAAHNDERNTGWTARYKPWIIIHQEILPTKTEALKREKQLKTSRGRNFIRTLISKN